MAMCWPVKLLPVCFVIQGRASVQIGMPRQLTYLDLLSRSALEHSGGSTLRGFLKIKATFSFSDFTDITQRAMIPGILMAPKPVWLLPQNMKLLSDRCYNGCCNRMLSWSALGHVHHQPSLHTTWVGRDFWHFGWFSWNVCCRWMCWHRSGDLGCGIERDWLRRFQRSSWMEWWWNIVAKQPPSHVSKRTGQNVKTSSLNAITGPGEPAQSGLSKHYSSQKDGKNQQPRTLIRSFTDLNALYPNLPFFWLFFVSYPSLNRSASVSISRAATPVDMGNLRREAKRTKAQGCSGYVRIEQQIAWIISVKLTKFEVMIKLRINFKLWVMIE